MAKLHEVLAVEGQLKSQAEKCRGELAATFDKKRHLFARKVVTFQPADEGAPSVTEEQSDLQTTVRQELAWIADIMAKAMDASLQVADTNTHAKADLALEDGTVLLEALPATALLEMEKRAGEIQQLVSQIPTLDPAKGFTLDRDAGRGVYRARDDVRTRTKKVQRPVVLYEATKEHPAQVSLVNEDIPVGRIQTQEWSGLVTPAEKAEMLERAEHLRRAIKQARSRANDTHILGPEVTVRALFQFVFDGEK